MNVICKHWIISQIQIFFDLKECAVRKKTKLFNISCLCCMNEWERHMSKKMGKEWVWVSGDSDMEEWEREERRRGEWESWGEIDKELLKTNLAYLPNLNDWYMLVPLLGVV